MGNRVNADWVKRGSGVKEIGNPRFLLDWTARPVRSPRIKVPLPVFPQVYGRRSETWIAPSVEVIIRCLRGDDSWRLELDEAVMQTVLLSEWTRMTGRLKEQLEQLTGLPVTQVPLRGKQGELQGVAIFPSHFTMLDVEELSSLVMGFPMRMGIYPLI